MECPVDAVTLLITVREGVEIDYCPQCRGVWLDRGELDKLLQRADDDWDDDDDDRGGYRDRDRSRSREAQYVQPKKKKKKKKGWLSEMFEFGE